MLRLGDLAELAFDPSLNEELLLVASVELARGNGVAEDVIVHTTADVDRYVMGVPQGRPQGGVRV